VFGDLAPAERVEVVWNGTPEPSRTATPGATRRVLYLANRRPRKGVQESVRAALRVCERVPDAEFHFVGNADSDELERAIRELARPAGERIRFFDAVSGADKDAAYAEAALLLFPPVEPEGHPRVVLEAVAAGLPVVATDRGAISETVEHGVNGYVLPDADPEALAEHVVRLLEDDGLRARMGAASLRLHRERFTQERADQRLAEWLEDVERGGVKAAPEGPAARLEPALRDLERWGTARDWRGTDPYEGLNAWRPALMMRRPLSRRLLMQAVKRSPVDLRPALGIPRRDNAVAMAQLVSAYSRAAFLAPDVASARMQGALERLLALRRPEFAEPCWSYHFDVETRAFFYAKTMPNTIATAFAGHALLDVHAREDRPEALALAGGVADFFCEQIGQTPGSGGAYFGYFIGDTSPIHNANMLACGFLARLATATGRTDLDARIRAGVGHALAHQRDDGAWRYAEKPGMGWVDGFHTGYMADALRHCAEALDEPLWWDRLDLALRYYASELVLADGTAKYYDGEAYPLDIQSNAQAIRTFALAATRDPEWLGTAWRVLDRTLDTMRRSDGAFLFQRRRLWANPTPHIRWAQAPMLEAMTLLDSVRRDLPAGPRMAAEPLS
jgi:hypothetical protein